MTLTLQTPSKIYVNWKCDIICPVLDPYNDDCRALTGTTFSKLRELSQLKHLALSYSDRWFIESRAAQLSLDTITIHHEITTDQVIYDTEQIGNYWLRHDNIGTYTGAEFIDPRVYLQPLEDLAESDAVESYFMMGLNGDGFKGIVGGLLAKQQMTDWLARERAMMPPENTWTPPEVKFAILKVSNDGDSRPYGCRCCPLFYKSGKGGRHDTCRRAGMPLQGKV